MRNILITVMMMIVMALLFSSIINTGGTGMRANIQTHGTQANNDIRNLQP